MGQSAWPHAPRADPQQGEPAGHRGAREGYREDPCDGEVRVAHPVVVPHDNGGDVSQPPNSGAPSSRRVVRQLAPGPAEVLMGAGAPAKVPRKFWGTEFWESTGQTPGESAPQILGHRAPRPLSASATAARGVPTTRPGQVFASGSALAIPTTSRQLDRTHSSRRSCRAARMGSRRFPGRPARRRGGRQTRGGRTGTGGAWSKGGQGKGRVANPLATNTTEASSYSGFGEDMSLRGLVWVAASAKTPS